MKFVVGLGNPGRKYARTRHNIGFRVVDRLAEKLAFGEAFNSKFKAEYLKTRLVDGQEVFLVKPQSFMNLSGEPVRSLLGYFKGASKDLLVVHDDLDLPLGHLRFRADGSSGGHRGIESLIECLGTRDFDRLKFGIGRDPRIDASDYVLAPFEEDCREELREAVERAVAAVEHWTHEGLRRSADVFNVRSRPASQDKE